jgi:K+-sensing histidine kinase KdpD
MGVRGAWIIAITAPFVAALLMVPLRTHTQASNLALVMVAVIAAAAVPGFRPAAIAAGVSAGVWFDFFLTRPYETFSIQHSTDVQTAILMTIVAALVGAIASRRRQAGEKAQRSGDEVVGLYVTAQMLSAGFQPSQVLETIAEQLQALLFVSRCVFDPGRPSLSEPMINRVGELDWTGHHWSLSHHGWPAVAVSLPVDNAGRPAGRYLLYGPATGGPVTIDRLLTAVALADLAGAALGHARSPQAAIAPVRE